MDTAVAFLEALKKEDVDWVLSCAQRQEIPENGVVMASRQSVEALYLVIDGVLGVFSPALGDERLALIGPGGMVGEIPFLDGQAATHTVVALEKSTVLALPVAVLQAKSFEDPSFAASLYRAIARSLLQQVRALSSRVAMQSGPTTSHKHNPAWQAIAAAMHHFESAIHEADRNARRSAAPVPEALVNTIQDRIAELARCMNEMIGDDADEDASLKQQIGAYVQEQFLPYLLLSDIGERIYSKPRGYAGDFLTIEKMYENRPRGAGFIGPVIDRCVLDASTSRAVRNRRKLLLDEITKTTADMSEGIARITSLACGPAQELFDAFEVFDGRSTIKATLVDFDFQALAFVADRRDRLKLQKSMRLINENLLYLALGRAELPGADEDLVYTVGLIDYFEDELVVRLLDLMHRMLRPGGRAIVGNFHPRNTAKAFMDYVFDWRLIHRDEDRLNALFERSAFGRPCTNLSFEQEGINLFAECIKE
jgi:extracellular factor (EF) 3-hydroxypalmitic acid methyl ester biosynthesis protein